MTTEPQTMLELADKIERHVQTLANTQMRLPLEAWGVIADDLLTAIRFLRATAAAQPVAPDASQNAIRLLRAEDERQSKLHELLETIREQIRTEVDPEHRPDSLFKNIQDAVYAMRGRMPLLNDAAIAAVFDPLYASPSPTPAGDTGAHVDLIPPGIYFSVDNFYDARTLCGCGDDFYQKWKSRWDEFPLSAEAAILERPTAMIKDRRI